MSKFTTGSRVVVIDADTNEVRKGTISRVCEEIGVAIVKFDDGNVEKVGFEFLGFEPETKVQEEKPTEPVEKSEITITPDEFRKISVEVMMKETAKSSPIVGLAFSVFCAKLHRALFFDAVEND